MSSVPVKKASGAGDNDRYIIIARLAVWASSTTLAYFSA